VAGWEMGVQCCWVEGVRGRWSERLWVQCFVTRVGLCIDLPNLHNRIKKNRGKTNQN